MTQGFRLIRATNYIFLAEAQSTQRYPLSSGNNMEKILGEPGVLARLKNRESCQISFG